MRKVPAFYSASGLESLVCSSARARAPVSGGRLTRPAEVVVELTTGHDVVNVPLTSPGLLQIYKTSLH